MNKKFFSTHFAVIMLLALVIPILAACGGGEQAGTGTEEEAPAAETDTEATEEGAAEEGATEEEATEEGAAEEEGATEEEAPVGDTTNAVPGVLRLNIGNEPATVDPQRTSFADENTVVLMNYQPLMSFNLDMEPIPGAAETVEVSDDGLVYTFKLREGSQYSDGTPLTAANFEYAWKRLADPEVAGEYQYLSCGIIEGYAEYAVTGCPDAEGNLLTVEEAQGLDLETLRDGVAVTAIDDATLEIRLTRPTPYFLGMAALWIGAPVREEDVEAGGEDWWYDAETYIGNGPFIMTEWEHDSRIVWERNPNYNGPLGPVQLEGVEMLMINEPQVAFQAYQNGELDLYSVTRDDLPVIEGDPVLSAELYQRGVDATFYVGFNNAIPPFDNQGVRQAFAQAINREAFIEDMQGGIGRPAYSFIPPGIPGHTDEITWEFDPEAAQQTLADAGFPNGEGLPPITITYGQNARTQQIFEWVANQYRENLGIEVGLDPVDSTAFTELTKNPETYPQMIILGWGPDYPDPQNFLSAVFRTGGSSAADIGYSNPEFDALVDEADISLDQAERLELYAQANELLLADSPVVFLYYREPKGLAKSYVSGITTETTSPLDTFPGFFNLPNITVEP